jgi:hypothetical protein
MLRRRVQAETRRYLTLFDGRELNTIADAGDNWGALHAHDNALQGAPFQSQKAATEALNAARPNPCAAHARLDNG